MSSPHVGGGFLTRQASNASVRVAAVQHAQAGSSAATAAAAGSVTSGRATPSIPGTPHRSISAQLANPHGRPIPIHGRRLSLSGAASEGVGGGEGDGSSIARSSWRPISPTRMATSGVAETPRMGMSYGVAGSVSFRAFPPSSRNPYPIHAHAAASPPTASSGDDPSMIGLPGAHPPAYEQQLLALQQQQQQQAMGHHPYGIGEGELDVNGMFDGGSGGGMLTEDFDAAALDLGASPVLFRDLPPVLKGYLLGQIACVVKFGIWWVSFTFFILALFDGDSYVVGGTRVCFNLALLLCSPMAGGIAERANIKKLLNHTVVARGMIYCLLIPVVWLLLDSKIIWDESDAMRVGFFALFLFFLFLDGLCVSFSNVADIDSGGVNLVALQYGIEIDDNVRNYFNSLHILFFDLSMVIFNPLIAYMGLLIGQKGVREITENPITIDELTLLITISGIFLVSTLATLFFYNYYMPALIPLPPLSDDGDYNVNGIPVQPALSSSGSFDDNLPPRYETGSNYPTVVGAQGGLNGDEGEYGLGGEPESESEPDPLSWSAFKGLMRSIHEGGVLTWRHKRIRWRVLFFAIETSIEDAMIALLAAEVGAYSFAPLNSDLHYAYGNLWGAGLVACGKLGGVMASMLMHRFFHVDPMTAGDAGSSSPYKPFFGFAFLGGLFSLLLPLAVQFRAHDALHEGITTSLAFLSLFLFFLFSTLSKIGFSTLMQSMAAEVEATGRVFGFVAAFVTAVDAILLMAFSALFAALPLHTALWIQCGFITLHGLLEFLLGPTLVLPEQTTGLDDQLKRDLAEPLQPLDM